MGYLEAMEANKEEGGESELRDGKIFEKQNC